MNLTSRRVPIEQFLEDLPHRKNEGILEKEFGVWLIIFYGGIFLPSHLLGNYVDLSDLYIVLSDLYVDLSDIMSTCQFILYDINWTRTRI